MMGGVPGALSRLALLLFSLAALPRAAAAPPGAAAAARGAAAALPPRDSDGYEPAPSGELEGLGVEGQGLLTPGPPGAFFREILPSFINTFFGSARDRQAEVDRARRADSFRADVLDRPNMFSGRGGLGPAFNADRDVLRDFVRPQQVRRAPYQESALRDLLAREQLRGSIPRLSPLEERALVAHLSDLLAADADDRFGRYGGETAGWDDYWDGGGRLGRGGYGDAGYEFGGGRFNSRPGGPGPGGGSRVGQILRDEDVLGRRARRPALWGLDAAGGGAGGGDFDGGNALEGFGDAGDSDLAGGSGSGFADYAGHPSGYASDGGYPSGSPSWESAGEAYGDVPAGGRSSGAKNARYLSRREGDRGREGAVPAAAGAVVAAGDGEVGGGDAAGNVPPDTGVVREALARVLEEYAAGQPAAALAPHFSPPGPEIEYPQQVIFAAAPAFSPAAGLLAEPAAGPAAAAAYSFPPYPPPPVPGYGSAGALYPPAFYPPPPPPAAAYAPAVYGAAADFPPPPWPIAGAAGAGPAGPDAGPGGSDYETMKRKAHENQFGSSKSQKKDFFVSFGGSFDKAFDVVKNRASEHAKPAPGTLIKALGELQQRKLQNKALKHAGKQAAAAVAAPPAASPAAPDKIVNVITHHTLEPISLPAPPPVVVHHAAAPCSVCASRRRLLAAVDGALGEKDG